MKTIGFLVAIAAIISILMAPEDQDDDLTTVQSWRSIEHVTGERSISQVAVRDEAIFGSSAQAATSRM